MLKFYLKVAIYLISFVISLFGLSAVDFNRYIKKGKIAQGWVLYFVLAMVMAYLFGNFSMSLIYYFQI